MGRLTSDMKRVVDEQRLGYWATVSADGTPNVSPKGTTRVWDDDHICFGNISSPRTVENIRRGSSVEVNVVDPLRRTGYRFKGTARIYDGGSAGFYAGLELLRHAGVRLLDRIDAVVVLEVREARRLVSPALDERVLSNTA